MKNITSREEFLLIKEDQLNEGIFGAIKGLFKSLKKMYTKIKGGKELNSKIEEYKDKVNKVFAQMTTAEQTKTAIGKNTQAAVESKIFEDDNNFAGTGEVETEDPDTAHQTGVDLQPGGNEPKDNTAKDPEGTNLNKEQIKTKIDIAKKHITQLRKSFINEVNVLKKRFADKEGKLPKKLEYMCSLAENQIADHIYQKWEEHFEQIGNKKAIQKIQKERAVIAKEMKTNTEALKQLIEGGDAEQRTFELDGKYDYTNSKGEEVKITVKELGDDGSVKSAELVNADGETVTINPYTDKIGKKVEEEEKPSQPQKTQGEAQPQTQVQKSQG